MHLPREENLNSWLLYQLNNRPPDIGIYGSILSTKNGGKFQKELPTIGPSVEIRTRGLLNPIQARYQTSPHPDSLIIILTNPSFVKYISSIYFHFL